MSNTVRKVADIMIVVAGKAFMFKLLCEYLDDGRQDLLADPLSTIDRLNGPISASVFVCAPRDGESVIAIDYGCSECGGSV
jgi:hypothetical protein